jgi:predicted N-acyltransferase
MGLNVYAFTCGWLTLPAGLLLQGEKGRLTVPVPSYLIEHPRGRVIFDTGLRAMRDAGIMIITGHDPELWQTIPQAPAQLGFVARSGG